jgi:hypothetical protein
MTTDRPFQTTAYKHYGQLSRQRPAPQPYRRLSYVNIFFTVLLLAALAPLAYLLVTGDFPGSRLFYGLAEDSPAVTTLLSLALDLF